MKSRIVQLEEEIVDLQRAVRFMYLTLGYYGTIFNYGENAFTGIMTDRGHDARQAQLYVQKLFPASEICNDFPGPKEEDVEGTWEAAKE